MRPKVYKPNPYHHRGLIDFDHCEKGRCINCSLEQQHKCEDDVDRDYKRRSGYES